MKLPQLMLKCTRTDEYLVAPLSVEATSHRCSHKCRPEHAAHIHEPHVVLSNAKTLLFFSIFVDGLSVTWFGAFCHGAVVHLVLELGPVVVHVDHIYVQFDGILHLVSVHVDGMSSQLWMQTNQRSPGSALNRGSGRLQALLI